MPTPKSWPREPPEAVEVGEVAQAKQLGAAEEELHLRGEAALHLGWRGLGVFGVFGCRVQGLGVQGLGLGFKGLGFRV